MICVAEVLSLDDVSAVGVTCMTGDCPRAYDVCLMKEP